MKLGHVLFPENLAVGALFRDFTRWCRKLLTGIIPTIPSEKKNSDFERIIKHACSFCVPSSHTKQKYKKKLLNAYHYN